MYPRNMVCFRYIIANTEHKVITWMMIIIIITTIINCKKTAILGTAHKLRKVLMLRYRTHEFHGRNNISCSTNCKYRTAAKLCTLETWFVSGI